MSLVLKNTNVAAMDSGTWTTVAASDNVTTGLREVVSAQASLSSDAIAAAAFCSVVIPNQITSPGVITIKTWTSAAAAATTFSRVVNWSVTGK